jgi:hypothetical protein
MTLIREIIFNTHQYIALKKNPVFIFAYCLVWSIWLFTRWWHSFFFLGVYLVISILLYSHIVVLCPYLCIFHPQLWVKQCICWMISIQYWICCILPSEYMITEFVIVVCIHSIFSVGHMILFNCIINYIIIIILQLALICYHWVYNNIGTLLILRDNKFQLLICCFRLHC